MSYRSADPSLFNKVLETGQITALFFDNHIRDNQGSISLEIVKNTDNPPGKVDGEPEQRTRETETRSGRKPILVTIVYKSPCPATELCPNR
ncbi:hypothetical protein MICAB_3460001 [Microcystis aeruginosa PCC 9717]|uniref:Uncharacterized protein n=1 Tax=Microcystis aeruginosa PCC 9717 TaxID=1160286 RepID=I4FPI2_MICAE|nr:hypothetical protein MICAB_3460001 [Microcystis aeruginosa PCC 9717]